MGVYNGQIIAACAYSKCIFLSLLIEVGVKVEGLVPKTLVEN